MGQPTQGPESGLFQAPYRAGIEVKAYQLEPLRLALGMPRVNPQKFVRGVPVDIKLRDTVMVRRLKSDLRAIGERFPRRNIVRVEIDRLPEDTPALALSRLLQRYRRLRELRLADASKSQQASAMLVVTSLQKRLLSSIEAFARTLDVHRRSMHGRVAEAARPGPKAGMDTSLDARALDLLEQTTGADDDRAELAEDDVEREADEQMAAATRQSLGQPAAGALAPELELLDDMAAIAKRSRHDADARVRHLIDWMRAHVCPDLGQENARWQPRRVLIFTEYADTKRYLHEQLGAAIEGSHRAGERIATFHGGMSEERREAIKEAFNSDPARHPLRVLIATDAAREGVNLQNHCADLFHFDIPWNPGRLEQRNGRIDRKLQKADEVNCYYFVLPQRAEDRVLDVLVDKTRTIHEELGSLSPVIERRIDRAFQRGIEHDQADILARTRERVDLDDPDDLGDPHTPDSPGEQRAAARIRTMRLELGHDEADRRRARLERELVVQRLLGRLLAQGFRDNDLCRACVLRTDQAISHVVLLGRLSLFGERGARLHDEILATAAEWLPPEQRADRKSLRAIPKAAHADILRQLEHALATQLAADRRHWDTRLQAIARELIEEPERVRRSYLVKAARVEPVGLVYLWPLSS